MVFDQSERAQGPIYVIMRNNSDNNDDDDNGCGTGLCSEFVIFIWFY